MHDPSRDTTLDMFLLPFTASSFDRQGEVILPWETVSVSTAFVMRSALQEPRGPRNAAFWLLASPFEYNPPIRIRYTPSVSAEEERVRNILRANVSKIALEDIYRSLAGEIEMIMDSQETNRQSVIEALHSWIEPASPVIGTTLGRNNLVDMYQYPLYAAQALTWDPPGVDDSFPDWVQAVLADGPQSTSTPSFINMVDALENALTRREFRLVDKLLASVDYGMISPEAMVAFVRTTYQARSCLGSWQDAVERIEDELTRRGLDARRVLIGLLS